METVEQLGAVRQGMNTLTAALAKTMASDDYNDLFCRLVWALCCWRHTMCCAPCVQPLHGWMVDNGECLSPPPPLASCCSVFAGAQGRRGGPQVRWAHLGSNNFGELRLVGMMLKVDQPPRPTRKRMPLQGNVPA